MLKKWVVATVVLAVMALLVVGGCSRTQQAALTSEHALQAAVVWLEGEYPGKAPTSDTNWQVGSVEIAAPGSMADPGTSVQQLTSNTLVATVQWPVGNQEQLVYDVRISDTRQGWFWEGTVDSVDRTVIEQVAMQPMTQDLAEAVAQKYVTGSPTYTFDGIPGTYQFVETERDAGSYSWKFVFEFDCSHAGYGDRAGQALAQVVTHHTAVVTVSDMDVVSAVMDDTWDMLTQDMLPK